MVVRGEALAFPAKILLATDGSEEADLAAATAADLAKSTDSELHIVHVGHMPMVFYESPGALMLDADLRSRMEEDAERAARTRLEELLQKLGRPAARSRKATRGRAPRHRDSGTRGEAGRRADSRGQPRARFLEEDRDGQRL